MKTSSQISGFASILLGITMIVALGLPVESALAHALLVKAEPPRRAALAMPSTQVRLWFNGEIEGDYASLTVLDGQKRPVTEVKPHLPLDDRVH